jgi:hypothetical protein
MKKMINFLLPGVEKVIPGIAKVELAICHSLVGRITSGRTEEAHQLVRSSGKSSSGNGNRGTH